MDRSPTPARDYRRYTTLEEGLDASSANSHLDGSGARARRELRRRRPLRTGAHAGSPHGSIHRKRRRRRARQCQGADRSVRKATSRDHVAGARRRRLRRRREPHRQRRRRSRLHQPRPRGCGEGQVEHAGDRRQRHGRRGRGVESGEDAYEGSDREDLHGTDHRLEGRRRNARQDPRHRARGGLGDAKRLRVLFPRRQERTVCANDGRSDEDRRDHQRHQLLQGVDRHAHDERADVQRAEDRVRVGRWCRGHARQPEQRQIPGPPPSVLRVQRGPGQGEAGHQGVPRLRQGARRPEDPRRALEKESPPRMRSLFAPSLLRALVGRNVLVSVAALVVVVAVALVESNELILGQFEDEASILADVAANEIGDQSDSATRAAGLVAGLPTTRELTEARDAEGLTTFLLPLKSRIGVDDMNVADNDGRIIAAAQEKTSDKLEPELVRLAQAQVQQSWVLFDEPQGLVIRAIYVIRNGNQDPIGIMEAGRVLGSNFLKSIKTRSNAELALIWSGRVRASTVDFAPDQQFPTTEEVDAMPRDVLIQTITAGSTRYYGIFRVIRSQRQNPGLLAVLVPTASVDQPQQTLIAILILLGVGLAALVTLISYRTAASITRPLATLAGAAQAIEAGDPKVRGR